MAALSVNAEKVRTLQEVPRRLEHDIEALLHVTPRQAAAHTAAAGGRLLDDVDRLGARTLARLHVEPYHGPVNRVPRPVSVLAGCAAILLVLFGWGAYQNTKGGDTWLTSPGAPNDEIAAQQYSMSMTPTGPAGTAMATPSAPPAAHTAPATSTTSATGLMRTMAADNPKLSCSRSSSASACGSGPSTVSDRTHAR